MGWNGMERCGLGWNGVGRRGDGMVLDRVGCGRVCEVGYVGWGWIGFGWSAF